MPLLRGRHRREGDDHDELRQEQHRLAQDQTPGVEAGHVLGKDHAGHQDVGVGEREEREQRMRVRRDLAQDPPTALDDGVPEAVRDPAWPHVAEGERTHEGRQPGADGDAEHRPEGGGEKEDRDGADDQPAQPDAQVHPAERAPALLALEDARLPADEGERHRGHADHQGGVPAGELEGPGDQRGQREAQHAEGDRGPVRRPHDAGLELLAPRRLGHDLPGAGGLQPQGQHVDHEQQAHQAGDRAVLGGAEHAGRHDGEPVGGNVLDTHRDRDAGTAAQEAAQASGGLRHAVSLDGGWIGRRTDTSNPKERLCRHGHDGC